MLLVRTASQSRCYRVRCRTPDTMAAREAVGCRIWHKRSRIHSYVVDVRLVEESWPALLVDWAIWRYKRFNVKGRVVCAKRAPWHVCLAGFEFAVVATGVCPLVLHIPRHPFARIESRVHINLLYQCHTYSLNVQKSSPDIAGDKTLCEGCLLTKMLFCTTISRDPSKKQPQYLTPLPRFHLPCTGAKPGFGW